jgi:hypothetical protein
MELLVNLNVVFKSELENFVSPLIFKGNEIFIREENFVIINNVKN